MPISVHDVEKCTELIRKGLVRCGIEGWRRARQEAWFVDPVSMEIVLHLFDCYPSGRGSNAQSLAAVTCLPYETVRRKLHTLEDQGICVRVGSREVKLSDASYRQVSKYMADVSEIMLRALRSA